MTHEDDRRTLTSIPYNDGELKVIVTKKECILGNHFHKKKTEEFILVRGYGRAIVNGHEIVMSPKKMLKIKPGDIHTFFLSKNSILVCVCSHPYDKHDDYEI